MSSRLEFSEDEHGRKPVLHWIIEQLDPHARRVLGTAMRQILQEEGVDVCTGFGRQQGRGCSSSGSERPEFLCVCFATHTVNG